MRVAVLYGGRSRERDISLKTGTAVVRAVKSLGYECIPIDPGFTVADDIVKAAADVYFIALHGRFGEDGTIQGLLEIMERPYTGSGVLASAATMDKVFTKKVLTATGIPTPDFISVTRREYDGTAGDLSALEIPFALPWVVKPSREGSSLGLSIVEERSALDKAVNTALSHDREALVERYVKGVEVTVTILGRHEPSALPVIEIVPASGRYDYESKYTVGATEYIIPPRLPDDIVAEAQALALKAHLALGCTDLSRVDLMIGDNGPQVLEINTIPGMTETSLVPKSAAAAGIEFADLVDRLIHWGASAR